jgi:hypothetical protein
VWIEEVIPVIELLVDAELPEDAFKLLLEFPADYRDFIPTVLGELIDLDGLERAQQIPSFIEQYTIMITSDPEPTKVDLRGIDSLAPFAAKDEVCQVVEISATEVRVISSEAAARALGAALHASKIVNNRNRQTLTR